VVLERMLDSFMVQPETSTETLSTRTGPAR